MKYLLVLWFLNPQGNLVTESLGYYVTELDCFAAAEVVLDERATEWDKAEGLYSNPRAVKGAWIAQCKS